MSSLDWRDTLAFAGGIEYRSLLEICLEEFNMRPEEAELLGKWLSSAQDISPVIELGSATLEFRTEDKPHIDRYIHAPLRSRGVSVVHSDIKSGRGIDISGDIYDERVSSRLKAVGARAVLCCNIFEHVTDREAFAGICDKILAPGGKMIVSVPYSYPYHLDPIDTYFRPSPAEIAKLFPGYSVEKTAVVRSGNYLKDTGIKGVIRDILKSLLFRGGLEPTKARAHRLFWLFRPYKVAVAVLKKPSH
jgi:hypothetical protein